MSADTGGDDPSRGGSTRSRLDTIILLVGGAMGFAIAEVGFNPIVIAVLVLSLVAAGALEIVERRRKKAED